MLPSEEIKQRINVVDLIGEYVQLKKAGINYRAVCPFHQEKTPSFMVSPAKQIWHCFGCGLGGDIFEFVKQIEGVEFPEAMQILAARAGVTLQKPTANYQKEVDQKKILFTINELAARFYSKVLEESSTAQTARDYLQKRGLKGETIRLWQIGYAPDDFHSFENFIEKKGYQRQEVVAAGLLIEKEGRYFDRFHGRIMFPLFDIHGRTVGFTARTLTPKEGAPKYVNSPDTLIYHKSQLIYGLHLAKTEIRRLGEVVVVEGNMDVITCHEAGFANVVGSSGTAFTETQLSMLKRFTENIVFAFDIDEAGLLATRRAVELALALGFNVKILSLPKSLAKDPDELIRKDPSLWTKQLNEAKNFLDFYFEATFAKMSENASNIEKKQAVADLLPLLSLLPDPIDRSHFVQKLAQKVSLDERLILEFLNKIIASKDKSVISDKSRPSFAPRRTRLELLERRVLGMLLKFGKNLSSDWEILDADDFSIPILREIFLTGFNILKERGELTSRDFALQYPKFIEEIELLVFAVENELSFAQDWNLSDVRRSFLAEFKLEVLKRKMRNISSRMKEAEQIGRAEEAKTLFQEFSNLSKELNKYYV